VDKTTIQGASTFAIELHLMETTFAMKSFFQLAVAVAVLSVLATGCMTNQGSCSAYQETEQPAELAD
jgi:outer membrane PBP1 activator LpoA protein